MKKENFIKEQGSFASNTATLAPLKCNTCGQNVPLQNHSPVTCKSCSASVEIPEEYIALKLQRETHRKQLEKASDVHRKLAKVPLASIEKLSTIFYNIMTFMVVPFYILGFLSIFIVFLACMFLANLTGSNWMDIYGIIKVHVIFGAIGVFILILPMMLEEVFLKGKELKRVIAASLSAKIHFGAKGEFDCRCCGNVLTTEANEQAVVCDYCDAENLIIYDEDYLKRISNDAKWKVGKIDAALNLEKAYKKEMQSSMYTYTGLYVVGIIVFLIVGWILNGALIPEGKPNWQSFDAQRSPYITNGAERSTVKNNLGGCYFSDWFMLNKGEVVEMKVDDSNAKMIILDDYNLGLNANEYETINNEDGSITFKYKANYTGTFKLEVKTENPATVFVKIIN
jgi:Zn finger protein HypA/HybF involved in hydrogenase expression